MKPGPIPAGHWSFLPGIMVIRSRGCLRVPGAANRFLPGPRPERQARGRQPRAEAAAGMRRRGAGAGYHRFVTGQPLGAAGDVTVVKESTAARDGLFGFLVAVLV